MAGKLTLVVSNEQVNEKIIAAIRPLDGEVVPSEEFPRGRRCGSCICALPPPETRGLRDRLPTAGP
jgi:hypothetical protein